MPRPHTPLTLLAAVCRVPRECAALVCDGGAMCGASACTSLPGHCCGTATYTWWRTGHDGCGRRSQCRNGGKPRPPHPVSMHSAAVGSRQTRFVRHKNNLWPDKPAPVPALALSLAVFSLVVHTRSANNKRRGSTPTSKTAGGCGIPTWLKTHATSHRQGGEGPALALSTPPRGTNADTPQRRGYTSTPLWYTHSCLVVMFCLITRV
jgi:hypothetical protein